jgi:ankyrin repeat protein
MKHLLITTIAAVLLVGCGEAQQSTPQAEPVEPVAEAVKSESTTVKAPDISIHDAAFKGNIEAVKQHLAAGTDVNAKDGDWTPLHVAAYGGAWEHFELLIGKGAEVNAIIKLGDFEGRTPLDLAIQSIPFPKGHPETVDLLRKHGGKTGEELKAEGK